MYFRYYLPLGKGVVLQKQTWIHFNRNVFRFVEIGPLGQEKKILYFAISVF